MAGWDGASSSAPAGSGDIVSPLTKMLQQVYFQTQFRGSSRDLLNPPPPPPDITAASAPFPSPVGMVAASSLSPSSDSGDESSWGLSDCGAAPKARAIGQEENAVLRYIDQLLMEDKIEQQACLDVGVSNMEAELLELIQNSPANSPPEVSTSSPTYYHHGSNSSPDSSSPSPRNNSSNSSNSQKKRGLLLASQQEKPFQLRISSVSLLERQRVLTQNGLSRASLFPTRPPRLVLNGERFTQWREMGLDSHLMDKLVVCGEAVSNHEFETAWSLAGELRSLGAAQEGNVSQRIVFYFLEALIARMHGTGEKLFEVMCKRRPSVAETMKAVQMIIRLTPFLSLPHLYTNRIILDSIKGASKIHIVDFGIMYGLQWPALFQMLAERREGIPQVRITGIDLPPKVINHNGRIRDTGTRLKNCARDWMIPFKFRSLAIRWETVEPGILQLKDDEVLIVCCSFKQTNLFDETVMAESPKNQWLLKVRQLNPRVFIQCLASSGFGEFMFLPRFREALVHHAAIFAAMDSCISKMLPERVVIEQDKYGREIMNIIACDGVQRVERSETHTKWNTRATRAGLEILPLNPALVEEAKVFARRYKRELTVGQDGQWLWLGWRNQIIHAYSAWKPSSSS